MGKFKEIDMDLDNYVFIKKSTCYILTVLLILACIFNMHIAVKNEKLADRNGQIEADRTEMMRDIKELQEENKALKSVVETYRIPNNQDTRTEE